MILKTSHNLGARVNAKDRHIRRSVINKAFIRWLPFSLYQTLLFLISESNHNAENTYIAKQIR